MKKRTNIKKTKKAISEKNEIAFSLILQNTNNMQKKFSNKKIS